MSKLNEFELEKLQAWCAHTVDNKSAFINIGSGLCRCRVCGFIDDEREANEYVAYALQLDDDTLNRIIEEEKAEINACHTTLRNCIELTKKDNKAGN